MRILYEADLPHIHNPLNNLKCKDWYTPVLIQDHNNLFNFFFFTSESFPFCILTVLTMGTYISFLINLLNEKKVREEKHPVS